MPNGHVLELATLPTRQPRVGEALLRAHALAAVIRLRVAPTPLPTGTMSREVTVDWVRKPGNNRARQLQREIGWTGIADIETSCDQYRITFNDHDLTEQAAVAVAALLIHDLQGGVIQRVLQIGSGGDYLVRTRRSKKPDQIEMSGIQEDTDGSEAKKRLRKKSEQVLTQCKAGFVSVTTFARSQPPTVHSYLHFVRRRRKKRKRRKVKCS
jgi:hypothetical protein